MKKLFGKGKSVFLQHQQNEDKMKMIVLPTAVFTMLLTG
jgi:hypothetical protein